MLQRKTATAEARAASSEPSAPGKTGADARREEKGRGHWA